MNNNKSSTLGIALLLPDGVGIRNFVLGPFLLEASAQGKVNLFHQLEPEYLPLYVKDDSVEWQNLLPFVDRPLPFVLRQALSAAQMYWINSPPMRAALNRTIHGSLRLRAAVKVGHWLGRAMASPSRMRLLEWTHNAVVARSKEVAYFRRVFEEIRPSVLFCSSQGPRVLIAPVLAAKQLGIPTAAFIFSWDNLSSKGRIVAPFDHFLVWSDHMKQELHEFYPYVSDQNIHVVGTPQFDPYAQKNLLWPRAEFFHRIGADPKRPLICYSGGDVENSKADHLHVRVLMELIRCNKIQGQPQVLLRPSPIDPGTRYDAVRREFPELMYARPAWLQYESPHGQFFGLLPLAEDVEFLANLTYHADLNINFASTMTLDFAIHDKPVVNVAFEVTEKFLFGTSMWEFVRGFRHYDPVVELGAARFALTIEEFVAQVNSYLKDPSLDREGRRRFVELEVGVPVGGCSKRVLESLQAIAFSVKGPNRSRDSYAEFAESAS